METWRGQPYGVEYCWYEEATIWMSLVEAVSIDYTRFETPMRGDVGHESREVTVQPSLAVTMALRARVPSKRITCTDLG